MKNFNKKIIDIVAKSLSKEIDKWANDGCSSFHDIKEVLEYNYNRSLDGYNLTKMLEKDYSYCSDSKLVDILNKAKDMIDSERIKLSLETLYSVKQRLSDEEIKQFSSKIKAGDSVSVFSKDHNRNVVGIVTKIYSFGKVEVYCPELGHVNPFDENDNGNGEGVLGIIVDIDKVKLIKE